MQHTTDQFRSMMTKAAEIAALASRTTITPLDVIVALVSKRFAGSQMLSGLGVTREHVQKFLAANQPEIGVAEADSLTVGYVSENGWQLAPDFAEIVSKWVRSLSHNYAGTEHAILAICEIPDRRIDALLTSARHTRESLKGCILEILGHPQ